MLVAAASTPDRQGLARLFGWPRVRFTLLLSLVIGLLLGLGWRSGLISVLDRAVLIGFMAMLAFGLVEQWPKRLPGWLARWVLQVFAVMVVIPITTFVVYVLSTPAGAPPFWQVTDRYEGFLVLTFLGMLIAPWAALAALIRQKEAFARNQALAFALERSELERKALDARLKVLQAQVEPHFLFNTLANVRELVDGGSPQASAVLGSLITYLRAAVPRLHQASSTIGQELDLARAYLEVMHMRMPDRLQFVVHADDAALAAQCPPMTLLTLVENAVRHGIDPSEEGGRIELRVSVGDGRVRAQVIDTGVGLKRGSQGLGTGLSNLRERMQLAFGDEVDLRLLPVEPHGVCAELDFPVRRA